MPARWTARRVRELKGRDRIPVVTCYDWSMARLCDEAEIPVLLVGDSLGNVILGHETTIPVTLEDMIHHAAAVVRAKPRSLVVVDLPFLTFQVSSERALEAAGRLVQATGADAVKLEGGRRSAEAIRRIVEAGVPVMGHLGLTPQSVLEFGGYGVQGRGRAGDALVEEARALEESGVFAIVLEKIPAPLAARITRTVSVPTIGIGAGPDCDGQVLVLYDLLGLVPSFQPRFVKRFADAGTLIVDALRRYGVEVRGGVFPAAEHSYADEPDDPGRASTPQVTRGQVPASREGGKQWDAPRVKVQRGRPAASGPKPPADAPPAEDGRKPAGRSPVTRARPRGRARRSR